MTIQVIWQRPDGTVQSLDSDISPVDIHEDNEESLLILAKVRASAFFTLRFGEMPRQDHLSAYLVQ